MKDEAVEKLIKAETQRQQNKLSMIPSENFFSREVRAAVGSVFMHKYSEGNIGERYYEGNQNVDELEKLTIARAKKVFKLPRSWGVNVQALAGSNANLAVYLAVLEVGDTLLAMYLPDGGHLSHGWSFEPDPKKRAEQANPRHLEYLGGARKVNITSKIYNAVQYKTDPVTRQFDYEIIAKIARKHRPKLMITGGTAYPRVIDHHKIKQIAQEVGALYLADIAHEAGLVAGGAFPSPVGIADVVTMTTHKTLRSGRGAIILAPQPLIDKINRAILPGLQGGPFDNNIAGICVGLGEALKPNFKVYAQQVIKNAKHLAKHLQERNFELVSGGTDKHLLLIDLDNQPLLGRPFAHALDAAGIVANYSTMPQEKRTPRNPSALRLGTPWLTTRGMKEPEMEQIAAWIQQVMTIAAPWRDMNFDQFVREANKSPELKKIATEIRALCAKFPLDF